MSFSSFSATQKDPQGTFPKGSRTQSRPFLAKRNTKRAGCGEPLVWEKESIHRPCSSEELFFTEKRATEEDFGGRYGFPSFYSVFVSTTGLESFSLRPEKVSRRFSFGCGVSVRFLLLCLVGQTPRFTFSLNLRCPEQGALRAGKLFNKTVKSRKPLGIPLISHSVPPSRCYRSIQNDERQTFILRAINSNDRYRIVQPDNLMSITETDLWECWQKISYYRCRLSLQFQLIFFTDTVFGLEANFNSVIMHFMVCAPLIFIASGKGAESLQKFRGNLRRICGEFSAMTPSRTTP